MLRNSVLVLGAIVVFAFAYYALSPLFKVITINEEPPQSLTGENSTTTTVFSSTKQPIVDTLTHPATGTVHIVQSDGEVTLRYENFKTINGPDLFVYLSKDLDATDFVNLGELKATEGNVNYPIPADIDVRQYRYALVWCKQFGVLFNYAELSPLTAASTTEPASTQRNATAPTVDITSQSSDTLSTAPKTALFGNGCFWCVESDLEKVPGVITAVSGYAGGTDQSPTYENYDDSGHREVVLVTYDPGRVSYANLVEHILKHGDPTDAAGSFGDRGLEYAPAIYYENESEETAAKAVIAAVNTRGVLPAPLTIPVLPRTTFWPAEEYHQDYAQKNPVRYKYYRTASGRDAFIEKYWGESAGQMTFSNGDNSSSVVFKEGWWQSYVRPDETTLRQQLTSLQYHVTQENGTEPAFKNIYDKHYEDGIYVDIVSGEPLFLSKDKYDSGTGWPSFVRPINDSVITLHEDNTLFTKRTEVRSRFANSHLGHVFNDGPQDRGGKRYCMNSAALRFIPKDDMERLGYGFLRAQM